LVKFSTKYENLILVCYEGFIELFNIHHYYSILYKSFLNYLIYQLSIKLSF